MKIKVYTNWESREICNEEEFIETMREEVEENLEEWGEAWLEEHYETWELFNLLDSEKEEIKKEMIDDLVNTTIDDRLGFEWELKTIDI